MTREYSQYGYERPRNRNGERWRDTENYGGERDSNEASFEGDGRQYGQPPRGYQREYGRDPSINRMENNWMGSNRMDTSGRNRVPPGRNSGYGQAGRSNYGSSRYGGSDYENGDFNRNESRYSTPYSETSEPRMQGNEWYGDDEVSATNWDGARGTGEWNSTTRSGYQQPGAPTSHSQWGEMSDNSDYQSYGQDIAQGAARFSSSDRQVQGYRDEPYQAGGYGGQSYLNQDYGDRPFNRNSARNYGERSRPYGPQPNQYDSQWMSTHQGKGPKGYERSDERTKEIVCEALMEAPHIDASDIHVEVKNREIVLTGTVSDRRTKYAAEELIDSKARNCEVRNELRVKSSVRDQESSQSSERKSSDYGYSRSVGRGETMSEGGVSTPAGLLSSGEQANAGESTQSLKQNSSGKQDVSKADGKEKSAQSKI